jgi:hypothetical protein
MAGWTLAQNKGFLQVGCGCAGTGGENRAAPKQMI